MTKRKFEVEVSTLVVVELDERVIDQVDDEWKGMFYQLHTPEDVAEHICYNLLVNRTSLSWLDGWADVPDNLAKLECYHPNELDWEFEATEIEKEKDD